MSNELNLETKIQYLKGVGPKFGARLNKLGIDTLYDLLFYYPRVYRDFSNTIKISELGSEHLGTNVTVKGNIVGIANKKTSRRRFTITEAVIEDRTGSLKVVWFNQPFLQKMLPAGREVILYGKLSHNSYTGEVVLESPERSLYARIEPIYSETEGISSKYINRLVYSVKDLISNITEHLPKEFFCHSRPDRESTSSKTILDPRVKPEDDKGGYDLLPIQEAILNIHFPKNAEMLERAKRRLAFDELFLVALKARLSKEEIKKENAPALSHPTDKIEKFVAGLPFELTADQKKAFREILCDMKEKTPMNRLLNGDVGSGKTIVAAIASYMAVLSGCRVAFMAPTSILAVQHYNTFCRLFLDQNINVGLYTADSKNFTESRSLNHESRKATKDRDSKFIIHNSDIVIGTQALIQKGVNLKKLGLVVVDEQHRFGVKQRAALLEMTSKAVEKMRPHFLSMTATPIPRTLHLALFGDLDISVIKEKPKNRKEIKTRLVDSFNREKAYEFIRAHLKHGRQVFVICPLIESKEKGVGGRENEPSGTGSVTPYSILHTPNLFEEDRKTVVKEFEKMHKVYPEYKIDMLHGKLKAKEKDEIMAKFSSGETNILVSTSVVEVGVDVPNATIMIIEDAERFGLAQLHQFRGRVGRGDHQSFCLLFSSTNAPVALKRLKSLEMTNDGFKLAEVDLETRGPGELFGTLQSGEIGLRMASFSDRELIAEASVAAKELVKADPELSNHIELKKKLKNFFETKHLE